MKMTSMLQTASTYRIHVVILYIALLSFYTTLAGVWTSKIAITIGAFASLLASAYFFNKCFNTTEDQVSQPTEARSSQSLFVLSLIMMLVPLFILWVGELALAPYAIFALISLGYSVPIGRLRIKSIPVLKNLYAAGSWWVSIVTIIVWYGQSPIDLRAIMWSTASSFFIALVFELLWDIRDQAGDAVAGHRTVPLLIGVSLTKIMMLLCLGFAWYFLGFSTLPITLLMLGYLSYNILFVTEKFPSTYYHATIYVMIAILITYTIGL